ncbi:MAG: phosphoadenosine phosphosulfate reductase family protein [Verrucomicrobiia bacterium]
MPTKALPPSNNWPDDPTKVRHVLSLSGGKDSAALAVYMRDRIPNMEYIFHDTAKELPDTYEYLERLEGYLGCRIIRTTFGTTFDHILRMKGGMLPSNHRRWCTEMMKLKPFENYIGGDYCVNYVGLRADEDREGYISHKPNIRTLYPFREDKIDYAGVQKILEESGLGLPPYTKWGRTRSGCFFCFYQQKIEWVRLKHRYPALYEEAKAYEKPNHVNGNTFYWNGDESLAELERPERMAQIEENWAKTQARLLKRQGNRSLAETIGGLEVAPQMKQGCLLCHL